MRCVSRFLLTLVAVGLIGACSLGPAEPTLDPGVVADLAPACTGQAVSKAGSLETGDSEINHVVLLDLGGAVFDWTNWIPAEWRPTSTADAELVTCTTSEPIREVIEVCPYNGPDITRYGVTSEFRVYEPSSGDELANFWITGEPRQCHATEEMSLTELVGTIDAEMVTAHLASLVEGGVFVDPDAPGSSFEPGPSSEPTTDIDAIELRAALEQDLITVSGTGDGLQSLDLELQSNVDRDLDVTVEVGTLLAPRAKATQTMVVVSGEDILLPAADTTAISLDVACVEMHQDQPDSADSFTVKPSSVEPALSQLLEYPEFTAETFRVQQFAVWTITNNPRRNGYVPLGTTLSVFGSGPDEEELDAIRDVFEAAGLDPSDFRALR